ncbi:MAG: 30S ribosomal protein S16 [Bacteroidales bacterium]|nr:30S ribosomal protein S16 [Bacteroidales bacterium]
MPTKIRLQRRGKKAAPFYHLVVADSRAPRDGKFIEKLGIYNPLTRPATIELNFDRALYWVSTGAQSSDTARAILSYKGVLFKNHLQIGVNKGAITQEQADAKFEKWLSEKQAGIEKDRLSFENETKDDLKNRLEAEKKVREDRDKIIAAKLKAEIKGEEEAVEETAPVDEAPVDEAPVVEVKEEPVAEVKEEAPVEEAKEEPVAEVKEEVVEEVKEEAKEEAPAEEEPKEEDNTEEKKED